jgi:hypothetical protein
MSRREGGGDRSVCVGRVRLSQAGPAPPQMPCGRKVPVKSERGHGR